MHKPASTTKLKQNPAMTPAPNKQERSAKSTGKKQKNSTPAQIPTQRKLEFTPSDLQRSKLFPQEELNFTPASPDLLEFHHESGNFIISSDEDDLGSFITPSSLVNHDDWEQPVEEPKPLSRKSTKEKSESQSSDSTLQSKSEKKSSKKKSKNEKDAGKEKVQSQLPFKFPSKITISDSQETTESTYKSSKLTVDPNPKPDSKHSTSSKKTDQKAFSGSSTKKDSQSSSQDSSKSSKLDSKKSKHTEHKEKKKGKSKDLGSEDEIILKKSSKKGIQERVRVKVEKPHHVDSANSTQSQPDHISIYEHSLPSSALVSSFTAPTSFLDRADPVAALPQNPVQISNPDLMLPPPPNIDDTEPEPLVIIRHLNCAMAGSLAVVITSFLQVIATRRARRAQTSKTAVKKRKTEKN